MKKQNNLLMLLGNEVSKDMRVYVDSSPLTFPQIDASLDYFISSEPYAELFYGPNHSREAEFDQNLAKLKGKDVTVIQSGSGDVTANSFHLLMMVHTLRKYGAGTVTVAMPFAPLNRQDRKFDKRFVSLGAEFFAAQLKSAGVDRVITITPHSQASIKTYQKCFGKNFTALQMTDLFAADIAQRFGGTDKIVIGAPDGADKPKDEGQLRARQLTRAIFGANLSDDDVNEYLFRISKGHTGVNTTEVRGFQGDVKRKNAVIVDDMIDGGGTMVNAANTLKDNGATSVTCYAAHGVLSESKNKEGMAVTAFEKLLSAKRADGSYVIDKVVLSDSMPTNIRTRLEQLAKDHPDFMSRVEILPTAPMILNKIYEAPAPHMTMNIALRKVRTAVCDFLHLKCK